MRALPTVTLGSATGSPQDPQKDAAARAPRLNQGLTGLVRLSCLEIRWSELSKECLCPVLLKKINMYTLSSYRPTSTSAFPPGTPRLTSACLQGRHFLQTPSRVCRHRLSPLSAAFTCGFCLCFAVKAALCFRSIIDKHFSSVLF